MKENFSRKFGKEKKCYRGKKEQPVCFFFIMILSENEIVLYLWPQGENVVHVPFLRKSLKNTTAEKKMKIIRLPIAQLLHSNGRHFKFYQEFQAK